MATVLCPGIVPLPIGRLNITSVEDRSGETTELRQLWQQLARKVDVSDVYCGLNEQ